MSYDIDSDDYWPLPASTKARVRMLRELRGVDAALKEAHRQGSRTGQGQCGTAPCLDSQDRDPMPASPAIHSTKLSRRSE